MKKQFIIAAALLGAGIAAQAATNIVNSNITSSEVWTSDNVYYLQNVVYVEPGATLKIEPGTRIIGNTDGSLVVAAGAQIFAKGTKDAPIVMTSDQDDGTYREVANEWGNLTLLGDAIISATLDGIGSDSGQPDGTDLAQMEGLAAAGTLSLYGGPNDDHDAGTVSYVSLRYHGKVLSQANELNGMSIGGVGRETRLDHIEIFNNIDDGIEIWGGTVNLKYVSIWNIGDDSFDLDQGWRGKAQFGLIVQGHCGGTSQGSGVGDNIFEMDGAENSVAQPFGAAGIYNFTAIGQPLDGDSGTEWRDNMRAQLRNCVFMDVGDAIIKDGGSGGDGGGYPVGDELATLFNRPFNVYPTNSVGVDPAQLYPNFTDGTWCEISDSVFYNLKEYASLTNFNQHVNNNVIDPATMPIAGITRAATVIQGGKQMQQVTYLNPVARGDAMTSVGTAPNDGFFTPVNYRGAFSPYYNWLEGWSFVAELGLVDTSMNSDPITIGQLELGAGFSFPSEAGVEYDIEFTDDLLDPFSVIDTVTGTGEVVDYIDVGVPANGFYRVVAK
jgi:hypothetical protein